MNEFMNAILLTLLLACNAMQCKPAKLVYVYLSLMNFCLKLLRLTPATGILPSYARVYGEIFLNGRPQFVPAGSFVRALDSLSFVPPPNCSLLE